MATPRSEDRKITSRQASSRWPLSATGAAFAVLLSPALRAAPGIANAYGTAADRAFVGLRKQLLVDDAVVAERSNLARVLGKTRKENEGNPVIVPDRPWEDAWHMGYFLSAYHLDGEFKLWYDVWANAVGHAASKDGLHWEKPALGVYNFTLEGARKLRLIKDPGGYTGSDNNIVFWNANGFCCTFDPHETDSMHRFKAGYGRPGVGRASLAHSPDGIHWYEYNGGEPVTHRAADTHDQVIWDEEAQLYRMYTRTDYQRIEQDRVRGTRGMVNPDIIADPTNWTTVRNWRFDREGPDETRRRMIYALTNWIYEGVHFAMMSVYEYPEVSRLLRSGNPIPDYHQKHDHDFMSYYIGTSRDGDSWDLQWVYAEQPLIERGPPGSFDKDGIRPPSSIITHNDRHWIYYGGLNERHNVKARQMGIGLATLRLDGFVALEAGKETGVLLTKPFELRGSRLQVNVEAPKGDIDVFVLDASGEPILDFYQTFSDVDTLRLEPDWYLKADLKSLKGQLIRLKFRLNEAKLYAFQIRP